MHWKQLVDRCGLYVEANRRLLLNLLYEAEEEMSKQCNIYEESVVINVSNQIIDNWGGDVLPLPYTEGWIGDGQVDMLGGGVTTEGATSYFVAPIQILVNGNQIKSIHEDEFVFKADNTKYKGTPKGYSIKNKYLNFSHILNLDDKVKIIYYGMVADHDEISPRISSIYHKELCYYACYMSQIKDKPDVASVFLNLWNESLLDIRNKEGSRDAVYTVKEVI